MRISNTAEEKPFPNRVFNFSLNSQKSKKLFTEIQGKNANKTKKLDPSRRKKITIFQLQSVPRKKLLMYITLTFEAL